MTVEEDNDKAERYDQAKIALCKENHRLAILEADFANIKYRLVLKLKEHNKLHLLNSPFHKDWIVYGDDGYILIELCQHIGTESHLAILSERKSKPHHIYYRVLPYFEFLENN